MKFPCPKCGGDGLGVLLFNLVAPCDSCSGLLPKREKQRYQVVSTKELRELPIMPKMLSPYVSYTREEAEKLLLNIGLLTMYAYFMPNDPLNNNFHIIDWGE